MGGRESQMDRRKSQIVDGREAKWVEEWMEGRPNGWKGEQNG